MLLKALVSAVGYLPEPAGETLLLKTKRHQAGTDLEVSLIVLDSAGGDVLAGLFCQLHTSRVT